MNTPTVSGQVQDYDVIVVGAGAAGLAATKALLDAGRSVICLEAGDRIGGRTHTDTEVFGVPIDLGAHWLHYGPINPFVDIGRALGFDIYPTPDRWLPGANDPARALIEHEVETLDDQLSHRATHGPDISMAEAFERSASDYSLTALMLHSLSMGRELDQISLLEWSREPEDEDWFCREGFGALVKAHAGPLPVRLDTPVQAITRTRDGVEVCTPDSRATAHTAIVTVSQGVLASDAIRFDPVLDHDRRRAIEAITMGIYNHVALQFPPGYLPVEPDTWVSEHITEMRNGAPWGGGFHLDTSGTGVVLYESSGRLASDLEAAGETAAIDFALDRLCGVFGNGIRKEFLKGHATRWGQNPLTRGSYSGALPGTTDLRSRLGQPHVERIHFAGEATHPHQMATVAGAHEEGLRAAQEVLASLG